MDTFNSYVTVMRNVYESLLNKIEKTDCVKQCYIVHLDTWNSYIASSKTNHSSCIFGNLTSHLFKIKILNCFRGFPARLKYL